MTWVEWGIVAGLGLIAGAGIGVSLGWHAAVVWFRFESQTRDAMFARRNRVTR